MTSNAGLGVNPNEFRSVDYIKITIFGFALTALWGSLHTVFLQVRLLDFVAEAQKNTYLGLLTFSGLMLAMVVQPIAGAISDRSRFSWGRRRPYILLGTIPVILLLPGIGLASSYVTIFVIYCLLQVSCNVAIGPYQGFIPDLVPEGKRGLASGVKTLFEIVGGVALLYPVAFFMDRYSAGQGEFWLWLSLGVLAIILLGTMVATVVTVKERPVVGSPKTPLLPALYNSFKVSIKTHPNFVRFLVSHLLSFIKRHPNFVWFLASRLFILMAFTTLQTFTLYFLKDVVGVADPAAATAKFSIVVVAGMLALAYHTGRLSDKIGRRPIAISSGLLGALGIVLIFLFQHSYIAIMCCGALVGISFGAFMSTNWALATDLVPEGEEARYLGLTNIATAGGAALARLIGPVIDFFNASSPNLGYSVMLGACFIYFIIGSALLLKVKGRR